jgi:hypothetical protein
MSSSLASLSAGGPLPALMARARQRGAGASKQGWQLK